MSLAGHESTANTLAWALFTLSQKPAVQTRLREELCATFPGDSVSPELETLTSLPYLDAVVRETLRFHAGVELVGRVVEEDDVMPVEKGYFAKDGTFHDHIRYAHRHFPPNYLVASRTDVLTYPQAQERRPYDDSYSTD
jgi:hypothetical protein